MTELEKELRASKRDTIKLLAEQMVALKFNEYKDYQISEDKELAYLDATIDILKKQIENAKLGEAKLFKFDKLEADRKNLTEKELKQLAEEQRKINEITDSFLATLEPRTSLKGRLYAPNSIILRYRGNGIDKEFSEKYPFGVLLASSVDPTPHLCRPEWPRYACFGAWGVLMRLCEC